jgi:hypothetical protein
MDETMYDREEYENIIDQQDKEIDYLRMKLRNKYIKSNIFLLCNLLLWRQFDRGYIGMTIYLLSIGM